MKSSFCFEKSSIGFVVELAHFQSNVLGKCTKNVHCFPLHQRFARHFVFSGQKYPWHLLDIFHEICWNGTVSQRKESQAPRALSATALTCSKSPRIRGILCVIAYQKHLAWLHSPPIQLNHNCWLCARYQSNLKLICTYSWIHTYNYMYWW